MSIYQDLGVRPFINAGGWTYTRYGGSIMPLEVLSAMTEASRHFVNLFDLQNAVGKRIADMTRNEAAFVSCGAASGILLAVASCIAGTDEALANHLPDSAGMRNEVVMPQRDRGTEADSAIRAAGGKVREVARLMGPRVIGLAAFHLNFVVATFFASTVGSGAISAVNYAWLIVMTPLGLFGMAMKANGIGVNPQLLGNLGSTAGRCSPAAPPPPA